MRSSTALHSRLRSVIAGTFNITVVPPGFLDFITVWPAGQAQPNASTLNSYIGTVVANAAIVPAGSSGSVDVFASQNTHLIIDINGYYAAQSGITLAQGTAGAPSLSFAGDPGTGVFSSGAGTLNLATAGTSRLRVLSNGDAELPGNFSVGGNQTVGGSLSSVSVGIGTNSPTSALDVRGSLTLDPGASPTLFTSASGDEQNRYLHIINSPEFPSASGLKTGGVLVSDQYSYANPGKNDLIVKGRVGIGTANPVTKLSVDGGTGHGVYGYSTNGVGVSGSSTDSAGVYGNSNSSEAAGVQGYGVKYGVYGYSLNEAGHFEGLVKVVGNLDVHFYASGGTDTVCRNGVRLAVCSSSLRYKTAVQPFQGGLELLNRLSPISFTWKSNGMPDLGLGAEDVAAVEPRLVTRNENGEVEGVKYDHVNVVLINAVKEQQAQIEQQRLEIQDLKQLVCLDHPEALVCGSADQPN